MRLRIFILFLVFYCCNSLHSQTPPFYNYTSSNGLPSSTIYDLMQDQDGYIWIATNNGLSRFDGTNFKNFGVKDGLNSSTIVSVIEGNSGEIYIGNLDKGINLIKDGILTNYTSTNSKIFRIGDIFFQENKLYAHSVDGFFVTYNNGFAEIVSQLNMMKSDKDNTLSAKGIKLLTRKVKKNINGIFLGLTTKGFYSINDSSLKKIDIENFKDEEIFNMYEDAKGTIFAGGKGAIYIINNNKVIKTIKTDNSDDKIFSLLCDSHNNIWFSVLNKGFRVIYSGSDKIFDLSIKFKIPKASVNKFMEDNNGNIWISTFGKGIFCLNNLYIKNYNEDDGLSNNNVQAFAKDNYERMIIGTYNGLNIMKNGVFETLKPAKENLTDYVYELQFKNNRVYTAITNFSNTNQIKFSKNQFIYFFGASICVTKDTTYLVGAWGNNYYKNKDLSKIYDKYFYALREEVKNNRVNKIFEDSKENLWFGTTLGLSKINSDKNELFIDNEILSSDIKSIAEDNNNNKIWIAGEKGVANFNLKTSEITNFINFHQFDLSASTSIAFDKYNRTWIGNTKGLFILNDDSVKYFNTKTGLPSNEILTLFSDKANNIMWIGTSNGFSSFDINYFDNYRLPPLSIKINEVRSGDSIYTDNDLVFEPENNNININFTALNFSSPSTISYQYTFEDEWIDAENNFLDFSSMKEGVYNLSLRAKMQNSSWSEPTYLSFTVNPKFTETIWFQLLIFIFVVGLILLVANNKIKQNRKKDTDQLEIAKRMNELKHQALSAMMNPHFIFNSLNSVQYLVNKNKKEEANDYIAMMGKLIRKNLDIAGNSFILLKEEIDRLKLYLEIEKLRFQDKFIYEIDVNNNIDIDSIMIPNMIIQPFVENAVWHGIMNIEKKGLVKISFKIENIQIDNSIYKCLILKITDNGIGYNKSKDNKKEGHISKGINIIEERLKILSNDFNLPQPVIIEDLSNLLQNETGTEVIISLPPTLYKH